MAEEHRARLTGLQHLLLARLRLDIEDPLGLNYILKSCDRLLQFLKSGKMSEDNDMGGFDHHGETSDSLLQIVSGHQFETKTKPTICTDSGDLGFHGR
jgi:hypothetical protein